MEDIILQVYLEYPQVTPADLLSSKSRKKDNYMGHMQIYNWRSYVESDWSSTYPSIKHLVKSKRE